MRSVPRYRPRSCAGREGAGNRLELGNAATLQWILAHLTLSRHHFGSGFPIRTLPCSSIALTIADAFSSPHPWLTADLIVSRIAAKAGVGEFTSCAKRSIRLASLSRCLSAKSVLKFRLTNAAPTPEIIGERKSATSRTPSTSRG